MQQAVALFNLFYYAKDYETFYKTAVWARQNINPRMFLYSFSIAVLHRPDTKGIMLPPIYELTPHFFFSSDVMKQAQYYKQISNSETSESYTVYSNYSGRYFSLEAEKTLSYFQEDIGLAIVHYYYSVHFPSWMDSEEFGFKNTQRGALFYYKTQ